MSFCTSAIQERVYWKLGGSKGSTLLYAIPRGKFLRLYCRFLRCSSKNGQVCVWRQRIPSFGLSEPLIYSLKHPGEEIRKVPGGGGGEEYKKFTLCRTVPSAVGGLRSYSGILRMAGSVHIYFRYGSPSFSQVGPANQNQYDNQMLGREPVLHKTSDIVYDPFNNSIKGSVSPPVGPDIVPGSFSWKSPRSLLQPLFDRGRLQRGSSICPPPCGQARYARSGARAQPREALILCAHPAPTTNCRHKHAENNAVILKREKKRGIGLPSFSAGEAR